LKVTVIIDVPWFELLGKNHRVSFDVEVDCHCSPPVGTHASVVGLDVEADWFP
jgi:hypothetical protein